MFLRERGMPLHWHDSRARFKSGKDDNCVQAGVCASTECECCQGCKKVTLRACTSGATMGAFHFAWFGIVIMILTVSVLCWD